MILLALIMPVMYILEYKILFDNIRVTFIILLFITVFHYGEKS